MAVRGGPINDLVAGPWCVAACEAGDVTPGDMLLRWQRLSHGMVRRARRRAGRVAPACRIGYALQPNSADSHCRHPATTTLGSAFLTDQTWSS
jgi:hypothetical protein